MEKIRAHILVSGIVQGVFYRQFTKNKAIEYNITGWVRNLPNGKVEILCEGEKGLVLEFIKELKMGPPSAHVTKVDVQWEKPTDEFNNFRIIYYYE